MEGTQLTHITTTTGTTLGTTIGLEAALNSTRVQKTVYQTPYINELIGATVNMQPDGITVDLSMRVGKAPQTIDDIPLMMANDYLKKRNIGMTLEEIIEKFLPEYTL